MRTLIVEDSADAAHMLKLILSPYGGVDIAADGVQGLEAFMAAWEEEDPYDLICLDIMMPKMDGLETLRRIREEEEKMGMGGTLGVRVVMTTAREDEATIRQAIVLGCEGYVFKTHGRKRILEKLKELGLITD